MTSASGQPHQASILIVDDTPANLELLISGLRERGYRARPVTSGELALRAARQSPPDLILLDVSMPGMDGYEVCRHLKKDPRLSEIPVLFVSALTETLDKVKAFAAGGVDYITKPFQWEEVEARVQAHLELARRKRLLEESFRKLQELEALRDNLTQTVVHDMRVPIFVVEGALQLLAPGAGADAETERILRAAKESLFTLQEMATQLLDIGRMEAGQMPLSPSRRDLVETARRACELYAYSAESRPLRLVAPEPVEAFYDEELVRRVISNLVGNALKFSPPGAEVTVAVSCEGAGARVAVSDAGPGIAPEFHAKIFEKYGQASVDRRRYGVGLGLTFCKLAVGAHGGTIGLESAPGRGSTFWFTLGPGEEAS